MGKPGPYTTYAWQQRRQWWKTRLPLDCAICGTPVHPDHEWHLHHITARYLGGQDHDTWPAHATCNIADGNRMRAEAQRVGAALLRAHHDDPTTPPPPRITPGQRPVPWGPPGTPAPRASAGTPLVGADALGSSPGPADSVWDAAPWLRSVRDVPAEGTWPRFMTAPHPRAVGSYGDAMIAAVRGELRWWQRLVSLRALEHDAEGVLVWPVLLLTMARQCGKSWWLREWCWWRLHAADLFGEPQTILHTGNNIAVCMEIQRPLHAYAKHHDGYYTRKANGQQEVSRGDDRWLVRSHFGVYGISASVGVVDEAWNVPPDVVEDGIEPTQPERRSPQLALISTANTQPTALMPERRDDAIDQLAEPGSVLLLEWSAPDDLEITDPAAWRAASPHWSETRRRLVAETLRRAANTSRTVGRKDPVRAFRAEWLNQWPARDEATGPGEPLLEDGAWQAAGDVLARPPGRLVAAVEDRTGIGAAAAAAGQLADGRVLVWGRLFPTRAAAAGWLELLRPAVLLVGASLAGDEAFTGFGEVRKAGGAETAAALPKLRELVAAGRLVHDRGAELTAQVAGLRVAERAGGLVVASPARSDLVRCAGWAVHAAAAAPVRRPLWAAV